MKREKLRNIAIIAHVDHGKTTLVDEMLKQTQDVRENKAVVERVMDNNDIERERGITILAKNCSVVYNDVKINIVDTPGHADFGGEVERVLKMVDGVLLLVDAAEGPMPQTRFVLKKALELNHKVIIVVNKIDKPDARSDEIGEEVLELLLDLEADEEHLESTIVFCSGRDGTATYSPNETGTDLTPLFEAIVKDIPAPDVDIDGPLQALVSAVDYSSFVGRIAVGRVERGILRKNSDVVLCDYHDDGALQKGRVTQILQFNGLERSEVEEAYAGDIVAFSGVSEATIGNTVCDPLNVEPIPFVKISQPTVEMTFAVNDSPFAGREGKFVTSRQVGDRLFKELLKDVSLRVERTENSDAFRVLGRGEMHLSILTENMRREGFEFSVSTPRVLYKETDEGLMEPAEHLVCDVPTEATGTIVDKICQRKGELISITPQGESRSRVEFTVPSRGLFGYRSEFLTDTKGEGIMSAVFSGYIPYKGEIKRRSFGSLIAYESGESVTYGLYNAQERGVLFIGPAVPVYAGMVVGYSPKSEDLVVNVCKRKQLTNTRASGSDDALRLITPKKLSLEEALEFLSDDELLEVTPQSIRIRKKTLDHSMRMRESKKD